MSYLRDGLLAMALAGLALLAVASESTALATLIDRLESVDGMSVEQARQAFAEAKARLQREPSAALEWRLKINECRWYNRRFATDRQDGLRFAQEARRQAEQSHDPHIIGKMKLCEARALYDAGARPQSLALYEEVFKASAAAADRELHAQAALELGDAYSTNGRLGEALVSLLESYRLYEALGPAHRMDAVEALERLAPVYMNTGAYDKAADFLKRTIEAKTQAGRTRQAALATINLGWVYQKQGRMELSIQTFERGLAMARELKSEDVRASALTALGAAYALGGRAADALPVLDEALVYWRSQKNETWTALSRLWRGMALAGLNRLDPALEDLDAAMLTLERQKALLPMWRIHGQRAAIYERQGQWQRAYREDVLFRELNEQIAQRDRRALDARLQVEFDVARRDAENQTLQRERQLLQDSDAAKARELQRAAELRRWQTAALTAGAVLLAALALLLWRVRRQAQRIRVQKAEVERALDSLQRAQQQLVLRERMASVGTLTAGLAHEMNNPANFAHAGAQALSSGLERFRQFLHELAEGADREVLGALDERIGGLQREAGTIVDGTTRIRGLVADLRSFARLDESERQRAPVSAGLLLTIQLVRSRYQHSVQIDCDLQADPELDCWAAQLNQAFMNLIVNACQAIEQKQQRAPAVEPGHLRIGTRLNGNALVIEFDDNGCGMPPEVVRRVFDPFYTTHEVGEGAGMGLSLAFSIVQRHGGSIEVQSEPNVGSCVTVTLPLNSVREAEVASYGLQISRPGG